MDNLALAGGKTDNGTGMVLFRFSLAFADLIITDSRLISKRLVKHDDEIVAEVLRHPSAVTSRIANDLVFFGYDLDIRTTVESIDNHIRVVRFGESEAKHGGTFRRRDFRHNVMVSQIHPVIIRFCHFRLMGKPAGTFILVKHHFTGNGHNGKLSVIVDPRAGLMSLLETTDLVRVVCVRPAVSHLSGLWHPEIHTPGHGNRRISITCRERNFRLASDQRIHVIHQVLFVGRIHRKEAAAKRNR